MTPAQAVRKLETMARRLPEYLRRAEGLNVNEGIRIAKKWSFGGISAAQLARMGHPYRIGGRPPADPALINRQSGLFYAAWHGKVGHWQGDSLKSQLVDTAPYAAFLDKGTLRMIARPIRFVIVNELRPRREKRLAAAIQRALSA